MNGRHAAALVVVPGSAAERSNVSRRQRARIISRSWSRDTAVAGDRRTDGVADCTAVRRDGLLNSGTRSVIEFVCKPKRLPGG